MLAASLKGKKVKNAYEKVHRAGKKERGRPHFLCVASFSVGLDREILVHREIGRGKEEKGCAAAHIRKRRGEIILFSH